MKIIHLIPSLESGGAEKMLYNLLKNKSDNYNTEVVTLKNGGFYANRVKALGIEVHELNIHNKKNIVKNTLKMLQIMKRADIIQSWMYHSDLIALIFGKILLKKKVVWGIRRSYVDKEHMKKTTYAIAKICMRLSRFPDAIVSCTKKGKESHCAFGYKNNNFIVIPNGFEIDFSKDEFKLKKNNKQMKLLNVARWEPLKDHENLLMALNILRLENYQFKIQLVGANIDKHNIELSQLIKKFRLEDYVSLLGVRSDVKELMKNADIYVSSSLSEGFPNVIGEAMSEGLFCVATNAGDTSYIISSYGIVTETNNPIKLAEGIKRAVNLDTDSFNAIRKSARARIEDKFTIQKIVCQYEEMYGKIKG